MSLLSKSARAAFAMTLGALLFGSCGPPEPTPEEKVRNDMYAAYDGQFGLIKPDYVVVTYPSSPQALTGYKADEFDVLKKVLKAHKIQHEMRSFGDAVVTLRKQYPTDDDPDPEYQAYGIPEPALTACRNGKLLIINLEADPAVRPALHPIAKEHEIDVRVWNDPFTAPKKRSKSR